MPNINNFYNTGWLSNSINSKQKMTWLLDNGVTQCF
jgi:hypothetical protein